MAFSLQNGGSSHEEPMAQINVTPFVDVVLVLLIIFMITAGVFDFGLEVDVPETREVSVTQQDAPFINITAEGQVFYNTEPIAPADIPARVQEDFAKQGEAGETQAGPPAVFVRADRAVPWETIAPVVQICGTAGLEVSMVTKPLERNPAPKKR